ncbi:hypothetical protein GCM10010398_58460 [Streptomyces fimbriatus]
MCRTQAKDHRAQGPLLVAHPAPPAAPAGRPRPDGVPGGECDAPDEGAPCRPGLPAPRGEAVASRRPRPGAGRGRRRPPCPGRAGTLTRPRRVHPGRPGGGSEVLARAGARRGGGARTGRPAARGLRHADGALPGPDGGRRPRLPPAPAADGAAPLRGIRPHGADPDPAWSVPPPVGGAEGDGR